MLAYLRLHDTIRPKDFTAAGVTSAQRLSQLLSALVIKHYLQGGNRLPYRLTPAAKFAGHEP